MPPLPLRARLARLEQPVEVDAVQAEVDGAVDAVERSLSGLRRRLQEAVPELAEAAADVRERTATVARIDAQTSSGVLGTLLSSIDDDGVEATRARAASSLSGSLSVLEHRMEAARGWIEGVERLAEDARYGEQILSALKERAIRGELGPALIDHIARAAAEVGGVPARSSGLGAPLQGPLTDADAVAQAAAEVLKALRSGGRAATVGESLLDRVLPAEGAVGRLVRGKVAQAAGDLVPDAERRTADVAQVEAEIEGERESARDRARRDEDARRRAMDELDALDDW